ncbi:hypothetical protein [Negadavirga shengliensis]|uniref:Uncharacterized protein n=1 Tax=Negadavirga shengliensis TaxID=1389218 RepID=A0ABV9T116_9BACT
MKKQNNIIMHYFWGTFIFHILIYAMLGHVTVKYGIIMSDYFVLILSLAGIFLTIPFTAKLISKFKQLAKIQVGGKGHGSIKDQLSLKHKILSGYYNFKKIYDYLVIPIHSAIGVVLSFHIIVPESVSFVSLPVITIFVFTMASCWWVVYTDNKKHFVQPLKEIRGILDEFDREQPKESGGNFH